jgi:hypothetical protein
MTLTTVEGDPMSEHMPPTPDRTGPMAPETPPRDQAPQDAPVPSRYDANLRLIHRRLADEKKPHRSKRWWKPGF